MAEYSDREHFLPIRRTDLVDHLCRRTPVGGGPRLTADEQLKFRRFAEIVAAYFHYLFHQHLESLKDLYSSFDPDRDTISIQTLTPEQRHERLEKLFQQFHQVLRRANFIHLSREEMEQATREVSLWGINLDIDFNCFDRLEVYYRGCGSSTRPRRVWYKPWIVEDVPLRVYQRLVLLIKQRPHKRLGKNADTQNVFLKLFKDIPTVDVEMLIPGGRLKMPGWEKGKLGASLASAVGFGAWKIYSDFAHLITGAATFLQQNPLTLYGPLSIVLGYGYRQYYTYQVTRQQYSHRLTESLYYQNLDSNAGVLSRLLDEAEEQECREVFLAYFFLWRDAPNEGWTAEQLDDYIEIDLERTLKMKVDFEISDALAKLERLGLITSLDSGRYVAVPIDEAMRRIDEMWDYLFPYNQEASR